MLDLVLDSRLKPALADPFLREARRSGVSLRDIELLSYDAKLVRAFLVAVREKRALAFVASVDRARLESLRAQREAPRAPLSEGARQFVG